MSKILVGIFDEHKLLLEGTSKLISNIPDLEVVIKVSDSDDLYQSLTHYMVHVMLVNIYQLKPSLLNMLLQVTNRFPKVKVLAMSAFEEEEIVLRTIKAGVKGFLAREADTSNLAEAIYTLRNGFDYYSNSITHLLVNKYIHKLNINSELIDSKMLSQREIEILRFWGNSLTNKEIADKLCISSRTVESHKNHIMQKLNLKTTVDLVKFAIKNNIIEI